MKARCKKELGDFQVGNVYELTEKPFCFVMEENGIVLSGVAKDSFNEYFEVMEE